MVALARERAPRARFLAASFLDVELPACAGVSAVGECFNYLFDENNTKRALGKLFRRIFAALRPGGFLVFDVAGPGRVPGGNRRNYREEDDWATLVSAEEKGGLLTRRITTFRKVGELYRRDHEVHQLRLFTRPEMMELLRQAGFRVRALAGYGELRFGPGHSGFVARKPM
jgi:SAM-dependent methyltransferase